MARRRSWRLGGGARLYAGALRPVERDLGFLGTAKLPRYAAWLETSWNVLATEDPNSGGNTAALRIVSGDGGCGRASTERCNR